MHKTTTSSAISVPAHSPGGGGERERHAHTRQKHLGRFEIRPKRRRHSPVLGKELWLSISSCSDNNQLRQLIETSSQLDSLLYELGFGRTTHSYCSAQMLQ